MRAGRRYYAEAQVTDRPVGRQRRWVAEFILDHFCRGSRSGSGDGGEEQLVRVGVPGEHLG
jgi:hypothetical protein